jgi:hypothetical protein
MPSPKPVSRHSAVFFVALLLTASGPTVAVAADGGKGGGTGGGAGGTGYGGMAGANAVDPSWLHAGGGGGSAGGGTGGIGPPDLLPGADWAAMAATVASTIKMALRQATAVMA